MAEGVIDVLEIVKIDKHQGPGAVVSTGIVEPKLEPVHGQQAIGQAGQVVIICQLEQVLFLHSQPGFNLLPLLDFLVQLFGALLHLEFEIVMRALQGQFNLAGFANEKGLEAIGSNLFLETAASGAADIAPPGQNGLGTVRQGYLEDSSVDAVREITELIEAQRGYEMNAKVISAADQMLGATTQIR